MPNSFILKILPTIIIAACFAGCAVPTSNEKKTPPTPTVKAIPRVQFMTPASGEIIAKYNRERSKGIDIAGTRGTAIVAAADGEVVYVGDQLRGYGKMIILKHDETYLTAYAHNQVILVEEKSLVRQGQTIAEMGDTDSDRVKLHFELRKNGLAIDPEPYLNKPILKMNQH